MGLSEAIQLSKDIHYLTDKIEYFTYSNKVRELVETSIVNEDLSIAIMLAVLVKETLFSTNDVKNYFGESVAKLVEEIIGESYRYEIKTVRLAEAIVDKRKMTRKSGLAKLRKLRGGDTALWLELKYIVLGLKAETLAV